MKRISLTPLALAAALLPLTALAQPAEGKLYAPGPFERLTIGGSADVRLSQGAEDQVLIAGDAEVQKTVQVALDDGRLSVHVKDGWKFWLHRRLIVTVTMRQPSEISLAGAANLQLLGPLKADKLTVKLSGTGQAHLDDVQAESLWIKIAGAGEARAGGRVQELGLIVAGKGRLQADKLQADKASVTISGLGNARLWVNEELRVRVAGAGFIDYWGHPLVRPSIAGTANIKALGDKP